MQNFVAIVGIILIALSILVLLFNLFVIITDAVWNSSRFYDMKTESLFITSILSFVMGIIILAISTAVGG